jgi:hypothetical protein
MKCTNKWKDRGWWVSVEIEKRTSARKKENLVRELLDRAQERYDLDLEGGKSLSRGIFTADADIQRLSKLLHLCKLWKGTKIYAKGNLLEIKKIGRLSGQLACAGTQAPCRSGDSHQQLAFLGCHQLRIGLLDYSLASLKKGDRYWFSYLKSEKGDYLHAALDKSELAKDLEPYQLCPLLPDVTETILEALPSRVSLRPINNRLFWVPTKRKIRTTWLCRFPPVIPCSAEHYRHWLEKLLAEVN